MAFNFSPKVVTDGLVLALDAANPRSYVSGSTVWSDLSPNGNRGVLTNGPTFNSANQGSIQFDGTNDLCVTSTILNFKSIGLFLYLDNGGSGWKYILDARPGMANSWITLFFDGSSIGIGSAWTSMYINAKQVSVSVPNIPRNTWFYLYVDSLTLNTAAIAFMNYTVPSQGASGNLSSVHVYNRTLSTSEILQNYNALKSRFGLT